MSMLRAVGGDDDDRARAIESWLGRFDSSATSTTMRSALRSIVALFPDQPQNIYLFPWEVCADAALYDEIEERLRQHMKPATASKYRSALNGLLRHLARHGLANRQAAAQTLDGAKQIRIPQSFDTVTITNDELRSMLTVATNHPNEVKAARDTALLALLAGTGARRNEVATLRANQLETTRKPGEATVEMLAQFATKGGQTRRAPLHPATVKHLQRWKDYGGGTGVTVLSPVAKNGRIDTDRSLGAHGIWKIVTDLKIEAGVDERITPHSFRRWFVTSLLEKGVDLLSVTRAVGHSNPSTTQRYDRRGDDVLRQAVLRLDLPSPEDLTGAPEEPY